jgi:hypothetical protein
MTGIANELEWRFALVGALMFVWIINWNLKLDQQRIEINFYFIRMAFNPLLIRYSVIIFRRQSYHSQLRIQEPRADRCIKTQVERNLENIRKEDWPFYLFTLCFHTLKLICNGIC